MTTSVDDLGGLMRTGNGKRVTLLNTLLVGLLGMGQVVAEGAAVPNSPYPSWSQPGQPVPGQVVPPPPGPYGGMPTGDSQSQASAPAPFAPPVAQWQSPTQSSGGMTREDFLAQQAARREAMEKQMQDMREQQQQRMQQQGSVNPDMDQRWQQMRAEHEKRVQQQAAQPMPQAMSREEMDKQMQTMRAEQEQRRQQQGWPSSKDQAAKMEKQMAEMRERHQAHWKAMQEKEQEMQKLFEDMRREHQQRMTTAGHPMTAPKAAEDMATQSAPQPPAAHQRPYGVMPPMPVYPYRAPYGYYPGRVNPYAAPAQ